MGLAFLPVPMTGTADGVGPIMALGITDFGEVLVITDEGFFKVINTESVRVDYRYDWSLPGWIDVSEVESAQEEETDDGGEEIPGVVPDTD
jgi:hypothetical protein